MAFAYYKVPGNCIRCIKIQLQEKWWAALLLSSLVLLYLMGHSARSIYQLRIFQLIGKIWKNYIANSFRQDVIKNIHCT